jgi:hypothetical protein
MQFDHVAFGVASVAELEKLRYALQDKGVEVTEVIDHGFCQSIYFTDPNGIALEASTWTEDIFEKPYHGDQQPVSAVYERREVSTATPGGVWPAAIGSRTAAGCSGDWITPGEPVDVSRKIQSAHR